MDRFMNNTTTDIRTVHRLIEKWTTNGKKEEFSDCLVREFQATIYLNEQEVITLLCTPEYLEDLAIGFLVFEERLNNKEDLESITADYNQGQIWVKSRAPQSMAEKTFAKRYIAVGGGKGTKIYNSNDNQSYNFIKSKLQITPEQILDGMKELETR